MSFATEKDALIAILKDKNCPATKDVYSNLNSYADIPTKFFRYGKAFDGDNVYLDTLAVLFDNPSLVAEGFIYNQVGAVLNNPKVVAKATYTTININTGGNYGQLDICDVSVIDEIIISGATRVESLNITGGSIVHKITVEAGSQIDMLLVKSENSLNSTLDKLSGSVIEVAVSEDSTFGGYECEYIPL